MSYIICRTSLWQLLTNQDINLLYSVDVMCVLLLSRPPLCTVVVETTLCMLGMCILPNWRYRTPCCIGHLQTLVCLFVCFKGSYSGHSNYVHCVCLRNGSSHFLSGSEDGTVRIWGELWFLLLISLISFPFTFVLHQIQLFPVAMLTFSSLPRYLVCVCMSDQLLPRTLLILKSWEWICSCTEVRDSPAIITMHVIVDCRQVLVSGWGVLPWTTVVTGWCAGDPWAPLSSTSPLPPLLPRQPPWSFLVALLHRQPSLLRTK